VAFDEDGNPTEFAPVRKVRGLHGKCEEFAGSANSGIASNYGEDCTARRPRSTAVGLPGQREHQLLYGKRLAPALLGDGQPEPGPQLQQRPDVQPAGTQNATRVQNQVFTVNWTQNLTRSTVRGLSERAHDPR
jgi:hypothetical protein